MNSVHLVAQILLLQHSFHSACIVNDGATGLNTNYNDRVSVSSPLLPSHSGQHYFPRYLSFYYFLFQFHLFFLAYSSRAAAEAPPPFRRTKNNKRNLRVKVLQQTLIQDSLANNKCIIKIYSHVHRTTTVTLSHFTQSVIKVSFKLPLSLDSPTEHRVSFSVRPPTTQKASNAFSRF